MLSRTNSTLPLTQVATIPHLSHEATPPGSAGTRTLCGWPEASRRGAAARPGPAATPRPQTLPVPPPRALVEGSCGPTQRASRSPGTGGTPPAPSPPSPHATPAYAARAQRVRYSTPRAASARVAQRAPRSAAAGLLSSHRTLVADGPEDEPRRLGQQARERFWHPQLRGHAEHQVVPRGAHAVGGGPERSAEHGGRPESALQARRECLGVLVGGVRAHAGAQGPSAVHEVRKRHQRLRHGALVSAGRWHTRRVAG